MDTVTPVKKPNTRRSMAASIAGAIVLVLLLFGIISSSIGLASFTNAFKKEYSTTTYHMADTASMLVYGDHLADYLDGRYPEEYQQMREYLNAYCQKIHVSLIYVICVDQSDYGRFVSVVNLVDNSVDDSSYTEWELGHKRDTTNDEYRTKYREIYENGSAYETVYRIKTTDGQHPHITTMVPVKDSAGIVTGILCMQRPVRELNDARRPYLITIAVSTVLLAVLASAAAAIFLRRRFVLPIRAIAGEATRFAKENTKGPELGDISKYKEISALAGSIDKMETDMVSYIENLTAVTSEKERIGAELSLAQNIQMNSIPNEFPAFPDRGEFDIYAVMDPAREVGGDFYNFFLVDDDHLLMVIGDVSGKGIPAALFMMVTNILVSDRARMGGAPAEILEYVNGEICAHNKAEMFVTIWLGILEISTGRLTAANAGHEYPALRSAGGNFGLIKDKHGFVVGGMEGVKYQDYELRLEPGDKLFVYTDGVPEATDARDRLFGTDRMLDALNGCADTDSAGVLGGMRRAVDGFVKDAEQFDDLTMLCLEYKGKGN